MIQDSTTVYEGRLPENEISGDQLMRREEKPDDWQMVILDPARIPSWMADPKQAIGRYISTISCDEFTDEVIRLMQDTRNLNETLPLYVHAAADIALMVGEPECLTTMVESQRPLETDQNVYTQALEDAWTIARYEADFRGIISHYLGFMSSLREEAEQQMEAMKRTGVEVLDQ